MRHQADPLSGRRGVLAGIIIVGAAIAALAAGAAGLLRLRETLPPDTAAAPVPPPIPTRLPLTATLPPATAALAESAGSPEPTGAPLPTATLIPSATPAGPTATFIPEEEPTELPPAVVAQQSSQTSGVTDPVDLPPGLYRVFFQTDAAASVVTPVVLEGDCGAYTLFETEGPFAGSATYRSTGCRVQFAISGGGSWQLVVETATRAGALSPPAGFSGDGPTATDRVQLPEGEYRLILETESPFSMVTPIVVRGPCLERPVILASAPGRYQAIYRSLGCEIVFEISSVTAYWELIVEPAQ